MKNCLFRLIFFIAFAIGTTISFANPEPLDSTSLGPNSVTNAASSQMLLWQTGLIQVVSTTGGDGPNPKDTCVVAMNGSNPSQCPPGLTPQLFCGMVAVDRMGAGSDNMSIIVTIHPACIDDTYKGGYRVAVNGYALGDKGADDYRGVGYACKITCVTSPVFNTFCSGMGNPAKC